MIVKFQSSARLGHEAEQLYIVRMTMRKSLGKRMVLVLVALALKGEASKVCTHSQEDTSVGRALRHSLGSLEGGLSQNQLDRAQMYSGMVVTLVRLSTGLSITLAFAMYCLSHICFLSHLMS